ncbi:MAG: FAD-binding protein, partial [Raoultibacter sp.]
HPVLEKEGGSPAGLLGTALIAAVEAAGIEMMLSTPATRLVTRMQPDGSIEVIGVTAQAKSGAINIRARKGIVLAAGGFDWNEAMLTHYVRGPVYGSWGVPQATGEGQKMAMAIGADMQLMTGAWWSPGHKVDFEKARKDQVPGSAAAINDCIRRGSICVNKSGKRFMNEASDYDSLGRVFCSRDCGPEVRGWTHLPAYLICDATTVAKYPMGKGAKPGEPGAVYTHYDSIEALAVGIGIDPAALKKTVDEFNANAQEGIDPEFGRGQDEFGQEYLRVDFDFEGAKRTLAPLETPPFYASEIVPVVLGTMGGVHVDAKAQAQHVDGSAIGRLYAQGNNAGVGVGGEFYAGAGATIAPGLAFGGIAAKEIAALEAWV